MSESDAKERISIFVTHCGSFRTLCVGHGRLEVRSLHELLAAYIWSSKL